MSDAPAEAAPPKKKRGLVRKLILFGALPLVLIGGGVGAGLYAASGKKAAHAEVEDPDRPKLMLKGSGEHGTPAKGPEPKVIDPRKYQATYYPIEQSFTSNLRDTDGFLQMGLGVSTFYDQKVIDNIKRADMPVRSAVLEVLSQQGAEGLSSPQGKEQLRTQLREAINKVLKEHEGFGGIDSVYFTSFIVQ